MRSVKGEITVFLSLSFTLLLSFIFGILESAVIQGSKNLSRIDTDRAIYSVFGEYHQELMEQYHVLGIDLGYRTGNYEEENLIQRLHYYNSGSTDHQIKGIQYLTDQSGQAFREQVLAYMEQRYGMDLVKKFTGTTEKWEQTETEESDMEKKTDEMTDQCSYLQLSIQYVQYSELQNMRNEGGGKYHKCEQCVYGQAMNGVYITSYGNRYHNSLNCSSLKRTIRAVYKSEVAGRGGCSKCAK